MSRQLHPFRFKTSSALFKTSLLIEVFLKTITSNNLRRAIFCVTNDTKRARNRLELPILPPWGIILQRRTTMPEERGSPSIKTVRNISYHIRTSGRATKRRERASSNSLLFFENVIEKAK